MRGHGPYGTRLSIAAFPALKRWANFRCAYGANDSYRISHRNIAALHRHDESGDPLRC
jgi:hypothetical protein